MVTDNILFPTSTLAIAIINLRDTIIFIFYIAIFVYLFIVITIFENDIAFNFI